MHGRCVSHAHWEGGVLIEHARAFAGASQPDVLALGCTCMPTVPTAQCQLSWRPCDIDIFSSRHMHGSSLFLKGLLTRSLGSSLALPNQQGSGRGLLPARPCRPGSAASQWTLARGARTVGRPTRRPQHVPARMPARPRPLV